jgi:hypothetical protein
MKLNTNPFPTSTVELEHKKILACTDQAKTTKGKNLDCQSNLPDVLHNGDGPSQRPEQTKEHVMMVGSWACRVLSETHIGG